MVSFKRLGLPPKAVEKTLASRVRLHGERIGSPLLKRFGGAPRSIAALILPPLGHNQSARNTYPTVFTTRGFGATHRLDGQQLSWQRHLMETSELPPMMWVALDYARQTVTTEFADSINNGPWSQALVNEVIPRSKHATEWMPIPPVASSPSTCRSVGSRYGR